MDAIICFQTAAKTVAHERRVVLNIFCVLCTAAAKKLALDPGIATGIAGHHRRAEIGHPLPGQAVEIVNAPEVCAIQSDRGKFWRRRRGVPLNNLPFESGVIFSIGPGWAGSCRVFPLRQCREPFSFPLRVGFGREPRDRRYRHFGWCVWAGIEIARPIFQIRWIGKNRFHSRPLPAWVGPNEFQKIFVRDREHIEVERVNGNFFQIGVCSKKRAINAGGNRCHAGGRPRGCQLLRRGLS